MSASAPNPQNILLLAVLGVGAFYFMSRRAVAAPAPATSGNGPMPSATDPRWTAINSGINVLGQLFGGINGGSYSNSFYGNASRSTIDNAARINNMDSDPGLNGSISDYATNTVDGAAVNPVTDSAFDWVGSLFG